LSNEFAFCPEDEAISNVRKKVPDKVTPEPRKAQSFDAEAWFARLDELGARNFLPDGIPDEPPAEPDPRVFFDK
jgi:antitoxin VapB